MFEHVLIDTTTFSNEYYANLLVKKAIFHFALCLKIIFWP